MINDDTTLIQRFPGGVRKEHPADIAHYVVVSQGAEAGKKIEIGLAPISVGRHDGNRFTLADPYVSAWHCLIRFEQGRVWVTDLNSTNGTFVDGRKTTGKVEWPIHVPLQVGNHLLYHEYRRRDDMRRSDELSKELLHAATYVQTLIPPPLREGPVIAEWHFLPSASLGGDIFDYGWLDKGHFSFYLLDVCGHGVGAALHSVSVFNLLRQRALLDVDLTRPADVLNALNMAMPMELYGDMYFTLWYGVYQPANRTLSFACAGHPPALVFDTEHRHRASLRSDDPPIGMVANLVYQESTVVLPPDVRVYLYSDGLYEITTVNGDVWSWAEFVRLLEGRQRAGAGQPEAIFRNICNLADKHRFDDDSSLLLFSFPGAGPT
ncbi:SpoIIE family protein phosphatase [Methylococcus sp. EFPC2]|uniref:SpoIIE family protein phosphatase n=1 Tax=Methylococcus sp. EFPC2 TaxID=2812648 RepID=UPI0019673A77|nr:SpoIIE family protein phosphatase [Methylococcus sp. EFPC2]QSA98589.1 SpoIIE family protein phosphatase [Methylococcus sp. EFPC2]